MYSAGLHIMFVEYNKKVDQFLESSSNSVNYNVFEFELLNEITYLLGEIVEQMEVEEAEHEGCIFDKKLLEEYGYYA